MNEELKINILHRLADVREDIDESFTDAMDKEERERMRELRIELLDMAGSIDKTAHSHGWSIHDWET